MRGSCSRRRASATSFVPMPVEVTADAVLGGRLLLKQPRRGPRGGHGGILPGGGWPGGWGGRGRGLGGGGGAARLGPGAGGGGRRGPLVEIDAGLAALAAENAQAN